MPAPIAALPMYNLPELEQTVARLWGQLREALRAEGVHAPEALSWGRQRHELWTDPALVLSQTCGLPYAQNLASQVELIGTPDYGLQGCPPGYYRSVILVRGDHPAMKLADLRRSSFAVNERNSQSGYAALVRALQPLAEQDDFHVSLVQTGSHANSLQAVLDGQTDAVSMDAVTWRLACRYQGLGNHLRPLLWTPPTPGLPLIAAKGQPVAAIRRAVTNAFQTLSESVRDVYGLGELQAIEPAAYFSALQQLRLAESVVLPRLADPHD